MLEELTGIIFSFGGLWNVLNMDLNNNEKLLELFCYFVGEKYFKQSNFTDTVLTILVIVFKQLFYKM